MEMINTNPKIFENQIIEFEIQNNIKVPKKYKEFLLKWNGGLVEPNLFYISESQGISALNTFFGIGEMYDNLDDFFEIYKGRIPDGFIPMGDDSAGNIICVGTTGKYQEKIYFWSHEEEVENPNTMENMFILAEDIFQFLDNLYEE